MNLIVPVFIIVPRFIIARIKINFDFVLLIPRVSIYRYIN